MSRQEIQEQESRSSMFTEANGGARPHDEGDVDGKFSDTSHAHILAIFQF